MGVPNGEKIMKLSFLRFDTIPARDRQTDGQMDGWTDTLLSQTHTMPLSLFNNDKGANECIKA